MNGADWRTEYKMTHKNGKISKITFSMWDYGKKGQNHIAKLPTAFKLFMSEPVCKAFDNQIKANTKKGYEEFYTDTYKYEWEGDNISKMTDSDGNYYKYTYDKKKNPFYGLFDMNDLDFSDMISKNNVTTEIDDDGDMIDYMYEYEKNIPVKCTSEYIHIFSHDYVRTETITKYYVYE